VYAEIPEQNVLLFFLLAFLKHYFPREDCMMFSTTLVSGHLLALMEGCMMDIFSRPCFQTFLSSSLSLSYAFNYLPYVSFANGLSPL
jgi:hypothetical protein